MWGARGGKRFQQACFCHGQSWSYQKYKMTTLRVLLILMKAIISSIYYLQLNCQISVSSNWLFDTDHVIFDTIPLRVSIYRYNRYQYTAADSVEMCMHAFSGQIENIALKVHVQIFFHMFFFYFTLHWPNSPIPNFELNGSSGFRTNRKDEYYAVLLKTPTLGVVAPGA